MASHSIIAVIALYGVLALSLFASSQAKVSDVKNALTFQWYNNVTAEKVEAYYHRDPTKHLVQLTELYDEINGSFLLEGTNFTSEYADSVSRRPSAGFVDTVFYSYQKHHNLIIRPDDVWTAIIVQFSRYINANAEALRHAFVNFEGKKTLEVKFYTSIDLVPINEFINKIVSLIDDNIDPRVSRWAKPHFTTTTINDKLTAGAALMATVQNYFDYRMSMILCGIPEVTILGDVNDWNDIRQRVEKLKSFELNGQDIMAKWSSMLGRIIDEFIKVKEGKQKDDDFWKQAIRVDYKTIYLGCSIEKQTYLNGWITAFSAFDRSGMWQKEARFVEYGESESENLPESSPWLKIRTDKITSGVVHVPINIYDEFAKPEEREYTGAIITGHMGYSVKMDETTLQPMSGWAMTITNKPPEYLRTRKTQNERLIFSN